MRTPSHRNSPSEEGEMVSKEGKGSINGLSGSDQESREICLRDLTLFQRVLAQNEQILAIQKAVIFDNDNQTHALRNNQQMLQTFNIFIENQKLLQNHLLSLQQQNSQVKLYHQDLQVVKKLKLGSKDFELIKLRDMLLQSNSEIFEKIERRHRDSKSSSGSLADTKEKQKLNSDSSLSSRNTPIFLFNVYNPASQNNDSKSSQTPEHNMSEQNTSGINQACDEVVSNRREGQATNAQKKSAVPKERGLVSALQKNIRLFLSQTNNSQANASQSQEQNKASNSDEQPNSSGN